MQEPINVADNEETDSEGVFGHFPFITAPRPPTAEEVQINQCENYVWPDLSFGQHRTGGESVHVNVNHIAEGTLFPFGGHLSTQWEYLVATALDPASVSTWIRIEDPGRCGLFRKPRIRLSSLCTYRWGKLVGKRRTSGI